MHTFERWFVAANKWVIILLLAGMSVIVFCNVSLRFMTNFSIVWAEEVARYAMIWMTFLGAGLAFRHGGLIAITNLPDALGDSAQKGMRALVCLILAIFCIAMMWFGYDYMSRAQFQMTPATRIPFSYVYAAIPVGFFLIIVHLLFILRRFVVHGRYVETDSLDEHSTIAT